MKKRLLAMLLALMLVVGLLPVGVLAADDVSVASENSLFTLNYRNDGAMNNTINVNLYNVDGKEIDTLTIDDARTAVHTVTVSLAESIRSEYDIEYVTVSGAADSVWNQRLDSYSVNLSSYTNDGAVINVYLCDALVIPDGLIEYGENDDFTSTRIYRIYDDQILKILHDNNVDVSASTTITAIKPNWKHEFSENYEEFDDLNRETDYWALTVTSGVANVAEVQPTNISGLTISYKGDSGSGEVSVPAEDLRYLKDTEAGVDHYYRIELNDDSFHIVYFYNEPGAQVINNYELYDVRFVEHNGNLVGNMPTDPTYPASSYYEFVAWTSDYNAGRPFLETTTVSEDITVYAQKRTTTSNNSWIYVMNDSNLLKERITELYNEAYVNWDSVKITVYSKDDEQTNPDYNLGQYNGNGWRDNGEYYHGYNYLSGVGDQQNESIAINNISKIVITANDTSGNDLGPVTIEKGIYDGDFWVSAGNTAAQYIAYIYINDNGVEDPDEEPGPEPVAKLDVEKTVAIPGGKGTAAVGDELEYTVTISSLNDVAAVDVIVTDTMWESGSSVKIGGKDGELQPVTADEDGCYVTVDVPADGSMVIYYTYTVPEKDAGKTVENTVTVGEMSVTTYTTVDEAGEPEEPGKPSEPTDDELNQLYVVLECINADAQHDEKHFRLDLDNSHVTVDFTTGICTVEPRYDFILQRYNELVTGGHTYADEVGSEKTFTLVWTGKAWDNGGGTSITRQVKCETPEPVKYAVNYHIVDANGKVIAELNKTDYVEAGKYAEYNLYQPTTEGDCTFSGWFQKVEDLEKDHAEVTALNKDKKWELYGRFTPVEPTAEWLQANVKIQVDCLNESAHHNNMDTRLIAGSYDKGTLSAREDGGWQYSFTVQAEKYLEAYAGKYGDHTANQSTRTVTLHFTDGEWVNHDPDNNIYAVFDVKCEPIVYTIHVSFVGPNGEAYGGGDVISTAPNDSVAIADPVAEGMEFVGWNKLVGLVEIYEGDFTYTALAELVGDDFTPDTHETWLTFEAVFEPIVYTIHVSFVGPNGEAYGGGDVISTMPDGTVEIADPVAEGMEFVGWKKLVGLEEIYNGEFTYTALAELVGDNFTTDTHEAWLKFEAVFEPIVYTIHVSFVGPNGEAYGGGDVISTIPDGTVKIADPVAEGMEFVGWKKLVGLEEIYTRDFTYAALAELVGDNFTTDTHEAWLKFEAVFEDETVEPDPYYIINIRFVDSDGTTSLGGGDVISTSPDAAYPSVPSPVAPQGMKFAGWKVWLGNEPMYEGAFTYNALKALREKLDGEITWVDGRTWITFQAVYEDVTVEPDPSVTGFTKTLVTDRYLYNARGIAYPDFYRRTVIVDEGDRVTLIYNITVKGTAGTEFTVCDDSADFAQTGVIPSTGETSFYVAKTFSWRDVRNAGDTLDNTASVSVDGETVKTDTERVPVDIDWDINVPDIDDDDDDDDTVYVPNWLNTTDHYAYIVGYEDGEVKPNNNITRAEVATIFFRLLTDDARAYYWSTDSGFSDVKPGDWYNNAVATMVNAGILNGYSDGTFKPNANITRAEFATIAARFLSNPYSTEDRFYDTEGHWAEVYINRAAEIGWISGYPDGSFRPDRVITRAEAVTLVNAVLGRAPHADYMLDDMITWPDNPESAWYYEAIQEATNSHDYRWNSGKSYEIWTKLLENR